MKNRDTRVNGWAQSTLLPPENLRIEATLHLDAASDTARVGIHVSDYVTDATLGIYTAPVSVSESTSDAVALLTELVEAALREHYSPF